MGAITDRNQKDYISTMEENQQEIRRMIMDSYHDTQAGKGRDYKDFFAELESRYRNAAV